MLQSQFTTSSHSRHMFIPATLWSVQRDKIIPDSGQEVIEIEIMSQDQLFIQAKLDIKSYN